MRLRVYNLILSAILVISLCAASLASPTDAGTDDKQKKEKVQVVVVEKRNRDEKKGGSRPGDDGKERRSHNQV